MGQVGIPLCTANVGLKNNSIASTNLHNCDPCFSEKNGQTDLWFLQSN